jgi:hypothetical protein
LAAAVAVSDYFRGIGVKLFLPDMLHLKGQALLAAGQPAAAQAAWREARTVAEALGSRRMGWRILAALARLETGEAARALWREANDLIEFIAVNIGDEGLRTSFRERAEVREVLGKATD